MPEIIRCGSCRQLLYFGEIIRRRLYMRAVPDEAAVLAQYDNTCPRCGTALELRTVDIETKGRVVDGAR